ncbi:MAG: hypothetical protein A2020_03785 [Lentisphaerae bacterium GWF2_45_14]|nr:MAG: hypothetical protein A2020_03785 [Lentisphaerae bacterium GWF2_45_14]
MDWRIFFSTFVMIFLAELGDKTQLSALAFSAGSKSTWSVFSGASVALVLSTFVAVLVGSVLNKQNLIPLSAIRLCAGALFIVFGILLVKTALSSKTETAEAKAEKVQGHAPAPGSAASLLFKAASGFEHAAIENYNALLARLSDENAKKLIASIIEEEKRHVAKLESLSKSSPQLAAATVPVASPEEIPAFEKADKSIFNEFIRHEEAQALFYRESAKHSLIPSVKKAFEELALEEQKHADIIKNAFSS